MKNPISIKYMRKSLKEYLFSPLIKILSKDDEHITSLSLSEVCHYRMKYKLRNPTWPFKNKRNTINNKRKEGIIIDIEP